VIEVEFVKLILSKLKQPDISCTEDLQWSAKKIAAVLTDFLEPYL
jgi:hypothetical protein